MPVILALVGVSLSSVPTLAQEASFDALVIEQVGPVDRAVVQLRVTNSGADAYTQSLLFQLSAPETGATLAERLVQLDLAPGASTAVSLPPHGRTYQVLDLVVKSGGQTLEVRPIHTGPMLDLGITLARAGWFVESVQKRGPDPDERQVPNPYYVGRSAPLLENGSAPPPDATFVQVWGSVPTQSATLHVYWVDARGGVIGMAGPYDVQVDHDKPVGPAMQSPPGTTTVVVDLAFVGGAVKSSSLALPAYEPNFGPGDPFFENQSEAWYVGALVVAGLVVGAGGAFVLARRSDRAPVGR